MGQIITDISAATEAFSILCPPDSDPVLSVADVNSILDGAARATLWVASTVYAMGSVIMPTVRNGRRYRLTAYDGSGTSTGATEPSWLVSTVSGVSVTDGNLTWQEDGEDYDSLWDIGRAVFLGWNMKASRAICAVDLQSGQMRQTQSQIFDHCVSMAQRYAPVYVA